MSALVIVDRLVFCPGIMFPSQASYEKANKLLKTFNIIVDLGMTQRTLTFNFFCTLVTI